MAKQFFLEENGAVTKPKWYTSQLIFRRILACVLVLVCASILHFCYCHSLKIVEGLSMQPTINSNYVKGSHYDIVLYNKFANAKRGDIVIVNFKEYDSQHPHVIKRVIATEGDTLKIDWNDVNQKLVVTLTKKGSTTPEILDEPYILKDSQDPTKDKSDAKKCAEKFLLKNGWWEKETYTNADGSITIPKGYFFFLGDNRGNSEDCCNFGPIKTTNLIGVVDTLIPDGSFLNNAIKFLFSMN